MTMLRNAILAIVVSASGTLSAQVSRSVDPKDWSSLSPLWADARTTQSGRQLADTKYFGVPAAPELAGRAIELSNNTRWINVKQEETVLLRKGKTAFAWTFATWSLISFDLAEIAPPGFLDRTPLPVYVAPNPQLDGGR